MVPSQRRTPFFPRAGPFLDLLPFKGPFSLTGAPYEEGRSLREGPGSHTGPSQRRTTKRLTGRQGPYGKPLTRRDGPYEKSPYGQTALREAPYGEGRSLRKGPQGPGCLTGPFTEKDDEEAYGKVGPLREAPYREGRSLRIGREFPLVRRRPKKVVFS